MARPSAENPFPRVREAREALRDKALEIFEEYKALAAKAAAQGDFETSEKILRFLMEHMPADEDGGRLLDTSIDKTDKKDKGPAGPQINIGFALGGIRKAAELPPATIDVVPDEE